MEQQRLAVDLPEETHRRLKAHCAMQGVKVADVVRKLVEEYLQKVERQKPKK
jgi:predicted DNA-binding protein